MKRFEKFQNFFSENGVDGIIFFRSNEIVMSSGYYPTLGLSFVLVTKDNNKFLYNPSLEPKSELPEDLEIKFYPSGEIGEDCWNILKELISRDIISEGLELSKIIYIENSSNLSPAVCHGEINLPPSDFLTFLNSKSNFKYQKKLNSLFEIKCYEDLKGIKFLFENAKEVIKQFNSLLTEGTSECEISGTIELEVRKLLKRTGIYSANSWCFIQGGKNTSYSGEYNRSSGYILKTGDAVLMELAICINGYWCDITRTGAVEHPSEDFVKIKEIVESAQSLAISIIKPGIPMREVDRIAREFIIEKGYGSNFTHGTGHQVGFKYHDPNDGISPNSSGVLKEGMILTVEPGIYLNDFGYRVEDNILVTSTGYEVLSR